MSDQPKFTIKDGKIVASVNGSTPVPATPADVVAEVKAIVTPEVQSVIIPALHTFWQTFAAVFGGGIVAVSSFSTLRDLAAAAVTAATAASFSLIKGLVKSKLTGSTTTNA